MVCFWCLAGPYVWRQGPGGGGGLQALSYCTAETLNKVDGMTAITDQTKWNAKNTLMLQHSLIMDFENIRIKFHIFYYFTTLLCFLFLFYSISSPLYIQFCSAALLLFFLLKKYLSTLFLVVRVYSVFLWIYCRWDLVWAPLYCFTNLSFWWGWPGACHQGCSLRMW